MCGGGGSSFLPDDMGFFDKILGGLSAAGSVATAASGLMRKEPKVSSAPRAVDDTAADAAAAEKRQRAMAAKTRQRATGLTGATGLGSPASVSLKTLFGGN
ncbi:hypothetical protein ACR42D_10015 [Desulfovibrio caledoniensis]